MAFAIIAVMQGSYEPVAEEGHRFPRNIVLTHPASIIDALLLALVLFREILGKNQDVLASSEPHRREYRPKKNPSGCMGR
jgi:hypothetical protein